MGKQYQQEKDKPNDQTTKWPSLEWERENQFWMQDEMLNLTETARLTWSTEFEIQSEALFICVQTGQFADFERYLQLILR